MGLDGRSDFSWSQIAIATTSWKIKELYRAAQSRSEHHLLSRSRFLLVPLGRAGLGGVEAPLRWPRSIRLEDCSDAGGGVSAIPTTVRMVLSAQRQHHALALYAQLELVRA